MLAPLRVAFITGPRGVWQIERLECVVGDSLPTADRLLVVEGLEQPMAEGAAWVLRGVTSNSRYTHRSELDALAAKQQGLGRPEATRAALIPIRKTDMWWALGQDERRTIFEETSKHIGIGLEYLPAVARRLHHSRELGEPFDFLTWFEYPPSAANAFEELVQRLRATEEWRYVDREVDIRLTRLSP